MGKGGLGQSPSAQVNEGVGSGARQMFGARFSPILVPLSSHLPLLFTSNLISPCFGLLSYDLALFGTENFGIAHNFLSLLTASLSAPTNSLGMFLSCPHYLSTCRHPLVPESVAPDLLHDAFLIIVPERAAQFVVIHGWPVLLDAPEPGNLRGTGGLWDGDASSAEEKWGADQKEHFRLLVPNAELVLQGSTSPQSQVW